MTFFIYFSLINEIFIFLGALILFFLPGTIAKWACIVFFISEIPWSITPQIIVIISDSGSISYTLFGIPALFLTPVLWFYAVWIFVGFESLFEHTNRDRLGRRRG